MQSKIDSSKTDGFQLSQWLARVLPFERVWMRYACCLWLGLSLAAAAWAYLVSQPATDKLLARSTYLLELEENLQQTKANVGNFDLKALRERASNAKSRLHSDAEDLDLTIVQIVDAQTLKGWKAVITSVERDTTSSDRLARASYALELKKEDRSTGSDDILAFLETIGTSEKKIAIDHLEILSGDSQPTMVFATLTAAIVK